MWNEIQQYLTELYNQNQFLQGGVILGFVTSVGYYLKSLAPKIWSRMQRYSKFYVTVEQHESQRLYTFIERWFREHHEKQYRNLKATLYDQEEEVSSPEHKSVLNPIKDKLGDSDEPSPAGLEYASLSADNKDEIFVNKRSELKMEQINDYFYIIYNNRYIRVSQSRDKLEHAGSIMSMHVETYNFSSWFGKKAINKLLLEITNWGEEIESRKKEKTTTSIYTSTSYGETQYLQDVDIKQLDKVIIEGKNDLIKDIDSFTQNKEWYKSRSIPYKRGLLFEGLPGNGKTTLALSLAQYYKKDIIVANLSNMYNEGLERLFTQSLNSRKILLLEDIDAMAQNRQELEVTANGVESKEKVDLSTLLNCMDGVFSKEGAMVIMTTNHPEKLDPALIRHGRVDYRFKITNPTVSSISKYVSLFFEDNIDFSDLLDGKYLENLSMVNVQDICIRNKDSRNFAVKTILSSMKMKSKVLAQAV